MELQFFDFYVIINFVICVAIAAVPELFNFFVLMGRPVMLFAVAYIIVSCIMFLALCVQLFFYWVGLIDAIN